MSDGSALEGEGGLMRKLHNIVIMGLKTILFPLMMFFMVFVFFPRNVGLSTLGNIMFQAVAPATLAWGVLFNQKVGNWNFAVGATAMAAAIFGGRIAVRLNMGIAGVVLFCIILGILLGALNGITYVILKVPTVIVSLGICLVLEGLSSIAYGGEGIMLPDEYVRLNFWPAQIIFGLCTMVLAFVMYNYLPLGYHIRAVGNGPSIAAQKGINAFRVKVLAMIVGGLFAGLYGAVTLGTTGVYRTVTSSMGTMGTCFDAMMCCYVATCLERSSNLVVSVYIGAVTLRLLKLFLMLAGTQSYYDQIFVAVFILIFLSISTRSETVRNENIYKHRILTNVKL